MERYLGVHGRRNVEKILDAVRASGGIILNAPNPSSAPYELRIQTQSGEVMDLVCYAFTANKYLQDGRPDDEHRFQVKYGSDFKRAHHLFIDPSMSTTTLMFGVHDSMGLFIAADATAHTPTWFSSSIEFKEHELRKASRSGWHGWERDRMKAGRRRVAPDRADENMTIETLVAFTPEHFLDFAKFERIAAGMDAGERLLLSDRVEASIDRPKSIRRLLAWPPKLGALEDAAKHPLLIQLGLSGEELLEALQSRFRLLAAVRGSVAEVHLGRLLKKLPGITDIRHLDLDGQPDFEISYKKKLFRIECKNVLRTTTPSGARVDFQKTRASKSNPCSRYYDKNQFEVLAACLHPVTEKWEFRFCRTSELPVHTKCDGKLSEKVYVHGSEWYEDLPKLLDHL